MKKNCLAVRMEWVKWIDVIRTWLSSRWQQQRPSDPDQLMRQARIDIIIHFIYFILFNFIHLLLLPQFSSTFAQKRFTFGIEILFFNVLALFFSLLLFFCRFFSELIALKFPILLIFLKNSIFHVRACHSVSTPHYNERQKLRG